MIPILLRASLRYAQRQPWQLLLAALGITLGVAVVTAIDLTRHSASQAFDDATESVVGRTTHQILAGPSGLDEALYSQLRRSALIRDLAPVIEAELPLLEEGGSLRVMGIDPVVEAPLRGYWSGIGDDSVDLSALITRPNTAMLSPPAAARLGVEVGDRIALRAAGRAAELEVLELLDAEGVPALAGSELAIVDIATAQELLDMAGRLSRIDLILPSDAALEPVRALLPEAVTLLPAASRTEALANMTRAFHTNLMALSLLALLVGMFLIYNSQTFMVIQRREQFGLLRALGLQRRQIAGMVVLEAALLGAVGALLGLLLGLLLARGLVGMVTQTINDLYYSLSIGALALPPEALLKGVVLGVGGSVLAALIPALEAGRVEPRAAMSRIELERRSGAHSGRLLWFGIALLATGALVLIPGRDIVTGLLGLFLVVIGFALMSPALTVLLSQLLQRIGWLRRRLPARLALRGVNASLSRTGVAVAALMLAVSHTIGIGLMVGSFRVSVEDWLENLLRADYYLALPASEVQGAPPPISQAQLAGVVELPGVAQLSHVRHLRLHHSGGIDTVAAYQLNDDARAGFQILNGPPPPLIWPRFEGEDGVLVSEPYAFHREVTVGDSVTLPTDSGPRPFEILAIYRDYASEQGTLAMSRATYDRHWQDAGVNGVGIYTDLDFDLERFRAELPRLLGSEAIEVIANRAIVEESLRIFDRTFTITEVLRLLAAVIAFIGVFSALMAIQLERTRELGVLKAIGFTPAQIRGIVVGESAVIGGAAGLFAIPVGVVMASLLIEVINRRSFGWGMALELDAAVILSALLMALLAALLAALYPAARMANRQPAEILRQE